MLIRQLFPYFHGIVNFLYIVANDGIELQTIRECNSGSQSKSGKSGNGQSSVEREGSDRPMKEISKKSANKEHEKREAEVGRRGSREPKRSQSPRDDRRRDDSRDSRSRSKSRSSRSSRSSESRSGSRSRSPSPPKR